MSRQGVFFFIIFTVPCTIKMLITNYIPNYFLAERGTTLVHLAHVKVDDDVLDCVERAINENQNEVNSRRGGYTPLLWVCWKIHGEVTMPLMKKLIDYGAADADATEEDGRSTWNALHSLCRYHTLPTLADLIKFLLEKQVEINAKSPFGFNALHLARAAIRRAPIYWALYDSCWSEGSM